MKVALLMDIGARKGGRKGQARHMPFPCISGKNQNMKRRKYNKY
jgi:hypothetical protein